MELLLQGNVALFILSAEERCDEVMLSRKLLIFVPSQMFNGVRLHRGDFGAESH